MVYSTPSAMDEMLANPTMMVIDNETFCWDEQLQVYTWCKMPIYSVPVSIIVLLSACYGLISLVAIFGNCLVIFVVWATRSMRNVTNFYIANLASADVFIAVFCIPFQFYAALLQRWDLPEFMCKFCPFAQTLSVNVSIFTLVTISVDRYKAVMRPLCERSSKTSAKAIIVAVWVISGAIALPQLFFFEFQYILDESKGGMKPFCMPKDPVNSTADVVYNDDLPLAPNYHSGNSSPAYYYDYDQEVAHNFDPVSPPSHLTYFHTYNVFLTLVQYVLPLTAISFAYAKMGTKLWLNKTPGAAHVKRDQMIVVNKKKTIKMLFVVVMTFGLCWLPWHLFHLTTLIFPQTIEYHYINILFFISHWLAMSNSCYNPFIYAIYSEKFKKEFRECAHCRRCRKICCGSDDTTVNGDHLDMAFDHDGATTPSRRRTYTTNLDVVLSDRRRSSALSNISAVTGNGFAPSSAAAAAATAAGKRPRFNTSQSMPPLSSEAEEQSQERTPCLPNGEGAVEDSADSAV